MIKLAMLYLKRMLYVIEGLFLDHKKIDTIHHVKNVITSKHTGSVAQSKKMTRKIEKTITYKIAIAQGGLRNG